MTRSKPGNQSASARAAPGRFRIIGGSCRGRRLSFPTNAGLRPTPDRVRETLFNWLAPVIQGARCLDLYAGSGALGLEALSRGAGHVMFVDRQSDVIRAIDGHLRLLGLAGGETRRADAAVFLRGRATRYDIVFLDPPYGSGKLAELCATLATNDWLGPDARIYIEQAANAGEPPLPAGWQLLRSARAGNVGYHLAAGPAARQDPDAAGEGQDR